MESVLGDLQKLTVRHGLDRRVSLLIYEKTELSEEIPLPEVSNPDLSSPRRLLEDRYLSPADDEEGVPFFSLPSDQGFLPVSLALDVREQQLQFLRLELGEERDMWKRTGGCGLPHFLRIKLRQPLTDIL